MSRTTLRSRRSALERGRLNRYLSARGIVTGSNASPGPEFPAACGREGSRGVESSADPVPDIDPNAPKRRVSARGRLRTYFLTGVIVAGPLAITAYITWWIIALIDSFVKPLIPASYLPDHYLPFSIPESVSSSRSWQ